MNLALNTTTSTVALQEPDAITEAVVSAVAEAEGASPLELRPLATVIDPDALGALVRDGEDVTVEFSYCGYKVCVSSGGEISVSAHNG